jgi:hypothetical protein
VAVVADEHLDGAGRHAARDLGSNVLEVVSQSQVPSLRSTRI